MRPRKTQTAGRGESEGNSGESADQHLMSKTTEFDQSARIDIKSIELDTRSLPTQQFKEWKVVVSSNGKEKK